MGKSRFELTSCKFQNTFEWFDEVKLLRIGPLLIDVVKKILTNRFQDKNFSYQMQKKIFLQGIRLD